MFDVKEAPTRKGKCEVVWYAKKSMAEHAAAGKALDCMHFRDKVTPLPPQLCWEDPYEKGHGPPLPTNLPHDALEKLARLGLAEKGRGEQWRVRELHEATEYLNRNWSALFESRARAVVNGVPIDDDLFSS